MTQEQGEEFGRLREKITTQLRQREFINAPTARPVFQFLVLPTWAPLTAWDVYRRGDVEGSLTLVRSCWRWDVDVEKFRSPIERLKHPGQISPTLEINQLNVDPDSLRQLVAELPLVEMHPEPSPNVTLDGVRYELAVCPPSVCLPSAEPFSEQRNAWSNASAGRPKLTAWTDKATLLFTQAWDDRVSE